MGDSQYASNWVPFYRLYETVTLLAVRICNQAGYPCTGNTEVKRLPNAQCPTNRNRFPPSVTYCVAANVIVRIGLDEFVRIVIQVTCYTWNTRKSMEF